MPNMTVLSPCDATQAQKAIIAAVEQTNGPVYLRFGREAVPDFTSVDLPFQIGKAQLLNQGNDLTIIATGHLTWEALQAAYKLKENGISARVLNMHTIKPIDKEAIISSAKETHGIITAEEHQITGGLGSAVAEVLAQNYPVPVEFIGMKDIFGESGKPEELMEKYEMTADHIVKSAIRLLKRTGN
jgi:transketolase